MKEIVLLAVAQLRDDRFRTLLSLLGVTVGIFAIVTVFTLVDSLQNSIGEGFESFGTDVCFVERIPLEPDLNENGVFQWWNYLGRPQVTYREYKYLSGALESGSVSFKCSTGDGVIGVTSGWESFIRERMSIGRALTTEELEGASVAMIGESVREKLFANENPIGRNIRLYGHNFKIVGVFESGGSNLVSTVDTDNSYIVPYKTLQNVVDVSQCESSIVLQGADREEVRVLMRQYRRLRPWMEDDFAINRLSFVLSEINDIISLVSKLGWIIGLFSLAVGAFGIMNIMYVSVQEREHEIGIQKALGARQKVIITQYLAESAVLALMGGFLGVLLVGICVSLIPDGLIDVRLTIGNVAVGLTVSMAVGILSGVAPAAKAASLNPVDAINAL